MLIFLYLHQSLKVFKVCRINRLNAFILYSTWIDCMMCILNPMAMDSMLQKKIFSSKRSLCKRLQFVVEFLKIELSMEESRLVSIEILIFKSIVFFLFLVSICLFVVTFRLIQIVANEFAWLCKLVYGPLRFTKISIGLLVTHHQYQCNKKGFCHWIIILTTKLSELTS